MQDLFPTQGVANPTQLLRDNASVLLHGAGSLALIGQAVDFDPVQPASVVLRLDGAQLTGATPRVSPTPPGEEEGVARGNPTVVLGWAPRISRQAPASAAFTLAATSTARIGLRNGRRVLVLEGDAPGGVVGTWGPFSQGAFTLALVVRTTRLVADYGVFLGDGSTLSLLGAPAAPFALALPSGASPVGGPFAGAPWDAVCLNQWRVVCVRNDPAGGRSVDVDGEPAASGPASTQAFPACALTVGGPGVDVGELVVWDGLLSDADLTATRAALATKWSVAVRAAPDPVTGAPLATATSLPAAGDATNAWPSGLPAPDLWLDAALPDVLCSDAAGTLPTPAGGRVACWRDASGYNRHLVPGAGRTATGRWRTDVTSLAFGTRAGVQLVGGTAWPTGLFAGTSSGPFTAVVVLRRLTGSSAHPLVINGRSAVLGPTAWVETVGVDADLTLDHPPPTWTADEPVLMAWDRGPEGSLAYRVGALDPTSGGYHCLSTAPVSDAIWASTSVATVGSTAAAGGLILAAACIWRTVSLTLAQRGTLAAWLGQRWGLAPPRVPVTLWSFQPHVTGLGVRYLRLSRTDGRSEAINVVALEAWNGAGVRYQPVSGSVVPLLGGYTWQNLNDENDATFAHTGFSPTAYMELDYGSNVPCTPRDAPSGLRSSSPTFAFRFGFGFRGGWASHLKSDWSIERIFRTPSYVSGCMAVHSPSKTKHVAICSPWSSMPRT